MDLPSISQQEARALLAGVRRQLARGKQLAGAFERGGRAGPVATARVQHAEVDVVAGLLGFAGRSLADLSFPRCGAKEGERVVPRDDKAVVERIAALGIDETSQPLEVSPATVKRDWTYARAWLLERMGAAD